ncbi:MAG: glycerol-3-phosphate 1-O-acyltransferase PlsY [Rhodospirillaceae bacterium]|nr:glycerol-3-phosphate 1-O-acyltransferase PlsY [Rhodospirillaceae bacterium]MCY4311175.1 glycerol-3-phosphate 1-O-acyltransferase PlsY [Rhodospirillaceae bacterium]
MPDPISWSFAWPYLLGAFGAGYLAGSIPFGLILTLHADKGDIRKIGSGNIGATNVLRTGSKGLALATLILDSGKGAAVLLIGHWTYGPDIGVAAGVGALFGHLFPIWLRFNGGKGVATAIGLLLAGNWPVGTAACLIWLLVAIMFRYSSVSALAAMIVAPVCAKVLGWADAPLLSSPIAYHQMAEFTALIAVLIWFRHAANIRRLLTHEEPKIGET